MDAAKWGRVGVVAIAVLTVAMFFGCEEAGTTGENGDDGDNGDDPGAVTLEDGDSWRIVGLGIDDDNSWFYGVDSTIDGSDIDIEYIASSDQDPPVGETDTAGFSVNAEHVLTIIHPDSDSVGRLNGTGTTFFVRSYDLTDDYGELVAGVRNGTGLSDATFSGDYWAAFVWADEDLEQHVYFTGTYDAVVDGAGSGTTENVDCDVPEAETMWEDSEFMYNVATNGNYSVPDGEDVIGIVREDGELVLAVETDDTGDNEEKRLYFAIQKSSGATGDLLVGTWDICTSCAGSSKSWYEGAGEMTLAADGTGTYTDSDEQEYLVELILADDGTLTFEYNEDGFLLDGAITPSGDTVVLVHTAAHPVEENYCIAVAIKEP